MSAPDLATPTTPSDDPFDLSPAGFYRRWWSSLPDRKELARVVQGLSATTQEQWIPAWEAVGSRHERLGDAHHEQGDTDAARHEYLLAKSYYAIARFPGEITPEKAAVSARCADVYRKACRHLDPPLELVELTHPDGRIVGHLRIPLASGAVPAVLIMCGSDVFKEDRGWAQDACLARGMAALIVDAPGTGQNTVPWSPEAVGAWVTAIDYLAGRDEIDADRIGALGISRGGYSALQLAGTVPERVAAVVAVGGQPFGELPPEPTLSRHLDALNERSRWFFGAPGDGPYVPPKTVEDLRADYARWSLAGLGLLDRITQPVLMVNGDQDLLSPIENIYSVLRHGPVTGKEVRIFSGAGHCAPEHAHEWIPAVSGWLAGRLGARQPHRPPASSGAGKGKDTAG